MQSKTNCLLEVLNIMDMKEQGRRTVSSKSYKKEQFRRDQRSVLGHVSRLTGRWDQGRR